MRSGAEVTRANTPFTEWLAGVGEEPAPCVDLARTQPLVADDRAMQQCAEPAPVRAASTSGLPLSSKPSGVGSAGSVNIWL